MTAAEMLAQAEALEWALEEFRTLDTLSNGFRSIEIRAEELRAKSDAMPVQEPVAWIQSNHLDNIRRDHRFHCSLADHQFQSDYLPLYTAPPNQSARIAELEGLLEQLWAYAPWPSNDPRRIALNAALAKGE